MDMLQELYGIDQDRISRINGQVLATCQTVERRHCQGELHAFEVRLSQSVRDLQGRYIGLLERLGAIPIGAMELPPLHAFTERVGADDAAANGLGGVTGAKAVRGDRSNPIVLGDD